MGLLDGILSQISGNGEGEAVVADLAEKVGLTPEQAQSAIGALADAHTQPGDTVGTAAANSGVSPDVLQQLLRHLGGEAGLAGLVPGFGGRAKGARE